MDTNRLLLHPYRKLSLHLLAGAKWALKILRYIRADHLIAFAVYSAIFFVVVALAGDRSQIVEGRSVKFNVDAPAKPIHPGDKVVVQWEVRELRHGCGGEILQLWIDGKGRVVDKLPADPVPARYQTNEDVQVFYRERKVPGILQPDEKDATFAPKRKGWCPEGNFLQHYLWPIEDKLPEAKFKLSERP